MRSRSADLPGWSHLLLLVVATAGCNGGLDCRAQPVSATGDGISSCSSGCCTGWTCGSDVYEIKCTSRATQTCACVKNGVTTREFDFIGWCSGDATRASANEHCGWTLL